MPDSPEESEEKANAEERHSVPLLPDLITDPTEKAKAESRNALRQFDMAIEMIEYGLDPERPFKLRPSAILGLQRAALEGITNYAGAYRPAGIEIRGSKHQPKGAFQVPELVEELCDYVNEHWSTATPMHLAAYVMWRLNWVHPFVDGNGRTSRTISYVVMCLKLGYRLPGVNTIPDQISVNKKPYYDALEAADKVYAESGTVDVSELEELLGNLLAKQLYQVHQDASGSTGKHDEAPSS